MGLLGRFSIRTRLYFGTVFSLVLLVLVGALGYVALDRTRSTLQDLFANQVQTLTRVSDLRTQLGELLRAEKDIIINANNVLEVGTLRESWNKTLGTLQKDPTRCAQPSKARRRSPNRWIRPWPSSRPTPRA